MDSRAFYDDYVDRQLAVGVNSRHRCILEWLGRFGMVAGQDVLEIGSGVGTLTGLLAQAIGPDGSVVGVDLSEKSIEAARDRLASFSNLDLRAADVLELDLESRFDVVVLPDVLEHIPLELHAGLFQRIAGWVRPDGFVLLHYPNPLFLEWVHEPRPEQLQEIDQPIYADALMTRAYAEGLYVDYLETYSIWIEQGDYVVAVLRPVPASPTFTEVTGPPSSIAGRLQHAMRRLLG